MAFIPKVEFELPKNFLFYVLLFGFPILVWRFLRMVLHNERLAKRLRLITRLKPNLRQFPACIVGFFHPYCDGGGGGERVLWTAVKSFQDAATHVISVIYTVEPEEAKEVKLERVKERWGIVIDPDLIEFVYSKKQWWIEASSFPRFTLLGQAIGSLMVAWDVLTRVIPDTFIDTSGHAFTLPLAKYMADCSVIAYVHYPTISTDMLKRVANRTAAYNNASVVAESSLLSTIKLYYYRAFAWLYGVAGSTTDLVMVNSNWTKGHIDQLWRLWGAETKLLYPPCDIENSVLYHLTNREPAIVSIAQFRPEKDHELQIKSFAEMLKLYPEFGKDKRVKLILIGGTRNAQDEKRVEALRSLAKTLDLEERINFIINAPQNILHFWLKTASVGLHTMWNEHFGISVVEYMAAGLIPVAHNSGGPKMDIVLPVGDKPTGFLATDESSFAKALGEALLVGMDGVEGPEMRARARAAVLKYGDVEFRAGWMRSVVPYIFV